MLDDAVSAGGVLHQLVEETGDLQDQLIVFLLGWGGEVTLFHT